MPARLFFIACLALGACACAGGVSPPPLAAYPFGQAPPPAQAPGQGWWGVLLAGLALGAGLAALGRCWLWERALRRAQGRLLAADAGRLLLLLDLLEDLMARAVRRGRVVSLRDWLRAKGRGPGGRL